RGGIAAAGLGEVGAAAALLLATGVGAPGAVAPGVRLLLVRGEVRGRLVAADAVVVAVQVLAVVVVAPGDVAVPVAVRLGAVLERVVAVVGHGGGRYGGQGEGGEGRGGGGTERMHGEDPPGSGVWVCLVRERRS